MTAGIQRIHLFVDGNYLYFSARGAGLHQDFTKLESRIIEKFGGPANAEIVARYFYTRPPAETDPRAVAGWLKVHDWRVVTFSYTHTTQDTLYVSMIHDMWHTLTSLGDADEGERTRFVVVSGSGSLVYPLMTFPKAVTLACVAASSNKRLLDLPTVAHIDLTELLK